MYPCQNHSLISSHCRDQNHSLIQSHCRDELLYIPSILFNITPNIYTGFPTQEHHFIYVKDIYIRKPLSLHDILTYFPSKILTAQNISYKLRSYTYRLMLSL